MKFQLVIDRQGVAIFPYETDLKYDESDKVFFDTDCKQRGYDNLYELIEQLVPQEPLKNWKHQKRVINVTLEDEVDKKGEDIKTSEKT